MVRSPLSTAIRSMISAVLSVPSQTTMSSPSKCGIASKNRVILFSSLYAGITRLYLGSGCRCHIRESVLMNTLKHCLLRCLVRNVIDVGWCLNL